MAIPRTPQSFNVQQGNQQILSTWDLASGATSYTLYRSTDNITYILVATPGVNSYLDSDITLGTQYFYKVASTNSDGTSAFTSPQSVVPTPNGEMSLGEIRTLSKQRADRLNSDFVTLTEWNSYINQSLFELYDLLVNTYEDFFVADPVTFTTNGSTSIYALPNGTNFDAAPAFYKLRGVDLSVNASANAYVTINQFNFIDRNNYIYPNTGSTMYGVFNLRYRLMGANIQFIPTPSGNQTIQLWYIPRLTVLLADADTTTTGVSGWLEYVIVDAAIKALQKEESDVSVLMAQKAALQERIITSAPNRDAGGVGTISDVRRNSNSSNGPWNGFNGGF